MQCRVQLQGGIINVHGILESLVAGGAGFFLGAADGQGCKP
jgi:hypothetical protein